MIIHLLSKYIIAEVFVPTLFQTDKKTTKWHILKYINKLTLFEAENHSELSHNFTMFVCPHLVISC